MKLARTLLATWLLFSGIVAQAYPVGVNLNASAYFNADLPFLNLVKQASLAAGHPADAWTIWETDNSSGTDTLEEGYEQLDANGYVTSLTASPIPSGGQQFTKVKTVVVLGLNTATGASSPYPAVTYRLRFKGQGTLSISGDATDTLTNSTAGSYVSNTFTVATATSTGLQLTITAIGPTDYPSDISIVDNSLASSYDGGSIFHPTFLNTLTNTGSGGYAGIRFMDWEQTNNEFTYRNLIPTGNLSTGATSATLGATVHFSAIPGAGATSATLTANWVYNGTFKVTDASSNFLLTTGTYTLTFGDGETRAATLTNGSSAVTWTGGLTNAAGETVALSTIAYPWPFPSGTYQTIFASGDVRAVTYTLGASTMTWTGGLTQNATYVHSYDPMLVVSWKQSWASRPTASYVSYSLFTGVPFDVMVALCNQLSADCFTPIPVQWIENEARGTSSDVTSAATYVKNNLNSSLRSFMQISNEVWNSGFIQEKIAYHLGSAEWPGASGGAESSWRDNWTGQRTAQLSDIMNTVWGASFSRAIPVLGTQAASTGGMVTAMGCTFWTGTGNTPCSGHHIKAVAIAPYWPSQTISSADATTFNAQADCSGSTFHCNCMSQAMSSNVTSCGTLASVPSNGWQGQIEGWVSTYLSTISSNGYGVSLIAYEAGQSFDGSQNGLGNAIVDGFNRDANMGASYTSFLNWWRTNVGATNTNLLFVFNDEFQVGRYAWGNLESSMQTISPLTSAPQKYQAVMNYAAGGSQSGTGTAPFAPSRYFMAAANDRFFCAPDLPRCASF